MARFGVFCFPGTGHLHPMFALLRCLQRRGHEVVMFGIADTASAVRAAGIEFIAIGAQDFPAGTLRGLDQQLAKLRGFAALRFTLTRVKRSMRMVLREGPEVVRAAKVDALLVDEADFAGTVADLLGLRWISIALIPPLLLDDRFPPFWFGWQAGQSWGSRMRNRLGSRLLLRIAAPIFREVNAQRNAWGLKRFEHPMEGLSPLAQITQLPEALEFKVPGSKPPGLYYAGPFLYRNRPLAEDFPWHALDGRPLIYASFGTLQNGSEALFRTVAEACAVLGTQLVLTTGNGLNPSQLGTLHGDPLVVRFAPQLELLQRATLVITHAGLNTVLESISCGVPLVAIPLANDQPGVASRLKAAGACVVLPPGRLTVKRLRRAVQIVLRNPTFRESAQRLQAAFAQLEGPERAAKKIEEVLELRFDKTGTHG